jgi:glutamate decarboxylase
MLNTENPKTLVDVDNYLTPTYARDYFTVPNDDLTIEQESKDPRTVQQGIFNRIDLDARNSSDLGSCICDYMDPECDEIVKRAIGKVYIDHSEYPQTSALGEAVPAMIQQWYGGTPLTKAGENNHRIIGTVTIGSSEAIMLALIAHRQNWYDAWFEVYKNSNADSEQWIHDRPLLMYARDVHTCWNKYSLYYNVPALVFNLSDDNYLIDPAQADKYLRMSIYDVFSAAVNNDETAGRFYEVIQQELRLPQVLTNGTTQQIAYAKNRYLHQLVCCVGGVIGTTFTGQGDPIEELNNVLAQIRADTGSFIPIHVDAASGGFVVPFTNPDEQDFKWTFTLPHVSSINVSNHKFGMVYPGCGTVVFRNEDVVRPELIYKITYLGGNFTDYTVNFSRGSSMVLAAYYNLKRFGLNGFEKINTQCVANTQYLAGKIATVSDSTNGNLFTVISDTTHYPMVVWQLKSGVDVNWTLTQLSNLLQESGWKLPAYQLPYTSSEVPDGPYVMRVVTRQDVSAEKIDLLVEDIQSAVNTLEAQSAFIVSPEGKKFLRKEQKRVAYVGSGDYR